MQFDEDLETNHDASSEVKESTGDKDVPETFFPASHQQEQSFILDASGAGAAYNMCWITELIGYFNEDALVTAHDLVVKREQPLRTILRLGNETEVSQNHNHNEDWKCVGRVSVYQKVLPKESSRLLWELCEHRAHDYNEAIDILQREQDYNFDVTQPPISRMHIVRISNTRYMVMCHSHQAHHDNASMENYRQHVLKAYVALCQGSGNVGNDRSRRMAKSQNLLPSVHFQTYQKSHHPRRLSFNDALSLKFHLRQSDRHQQQASSTFYHSPQAQILEEPLDATHENEYLTFSKWQRESLSVSDYQEQLSYWLTELHGAQPMSFPKDYTANPEVIDSHWGNMVTFRIDTDIASRWKEMLRVYECNPNIGGLSLFHIMLSRWFHEKDVVTGAYFANRDEQNGHSYSERLGCYRNVLPIRSDSSGSPSYYDMLIQIRSKILKSRTAKDVPYQEVIAAMGDQSFRGFNIMYAFHKDENQSVPTSEMGFQLKVVHLTRYKTKFDIHLTMRWTLEGGIEGNIIYSIAKFGHSTMQRFADEFVHMLTAVASNDLAKVHILELPMVCPNDLIMIRDTWNESKPEPPFPPPKSVAVTLFDAMHHHSMRVAVQDAASGRTYTYSQLLNQSMRVAAGIRTIKKSNKTNQFCVGLIFDRGISMYATMLAVLFCGGILVPIDASHTPVDRAFFLLQDSGADIVIYDEANINFISKLREHENIMTDLLSYSDLIATGKSCEMRDMVVVSHDSPFCIMYTSGTTGKPKGVVIMHSNVHNSIYWWKHLVSLQTEDKVLHFSSYSFVMSIRQIFPTIFIGATLVFPKSAMEFEDAIVKCGVTKMALTPSALSTVDPEKCSSLRVVQVAGEAPSKNLADMWASRLESFFIGLGPTELCGHACCGVFHIGDRVNIGMPVSNAAVYILNEAGQIQPPGVIGELCIAGENVTRGYLNREQLTQKHFVENPFDESRPRMYKVGDLARRLSDGKIEFIGRADSQVKIRGFRIELPEIIHSIVQSKLVQQARILPIKSKEDTSLVAYVVPQLDDKSMKSLRSYLSQNLPSYMVPQHIISLDIFPLNKNGKLDSSKLPKPSTDFIKSNESHESNDEIDRSNPTMLRVAEILSTELGFKDEGEIWKCMDKSFFEVGGTSLSAVRSARHISDVLTFEVKVTDLIQHATISDFITALKYEVEKRRQSQPSMPDDLNVYSNGISTQKAGHTLNSFGFVIFRSAMMAMLLIISVIFPVAIGIFSLLAIFEVVGFPRIIPILPVIYGIISFSNLIATSAFLCIFRVGKRNAAYAYPINSIEFLIWWISRRMVTITCNMFWFANGTKLMVFVFQALGAKIGSDVTIDNMVVDIPSLVSIGEGSYISLGTRMVCGEIRGDYLFVAPIQLESRVKTEPRSSILPGATISENCIIRTWASVLSSLPRTDEVREVLGSPAKYGDALDPIQHYVPPVTLRFPYFLFQLFLMYFLFVVSFIGVSLSLIVGVNVIGLRGRSAQLLYFTLAFLPVSFIILLLVIIMMKKILTIHSEVNILYTGSMDLARIWFIDTLLLSPMLTLALEYLVPSSLYHYFLKGIGGNAGKHTFWSSPQLIRAGCEHISIGECLHSGMMQLWDTQKISCEGISFKPIRIGDRCTIGQRVVIRPGVVFEDQVTVGSEGVLLEDMVVRKMGTVVGNPPTVFANYRDQDFSVKQLHFFNLKSQGTKLSFDKEDKEGSVLFFNVVAVTLNLLKLPFIISVFLGFYFAINPLLSALDNIIFRVFITGIITYLLGSCGIALALAVLTRSGIASFRKGYTGYYTARFIVWWFCQWLNRFCSGLLLYPFHGTNVYIIWMRLMGATIGKNCFIDPGINGFFEIDNLSVGNDAIVLTPNLHGHFVDHGTLQFAIVSLGSKVRINDGATIMPFTVVENNITLLTQCTTIKGMELKDPGIYMGNVASQLKTSNGNVVKDNDISKYAVFENLHPIPEENGDEENLYQ